VSDPDTSAGGLPEEAYAAALAGLARVGPGRLAALLAGRPPSAAWALAGDGDGLAAVDAAVCRACGGEKDARLTAVLWARAVAVTDVARDWAAMQAAGIGVTYLGAPAYPAALSADPEAPAVLFWLGRLDALGGRRVTVIGTRACTSTGAEVAAELGADLAAAGVSVVSGLAIGIDGAAHRGAVRAARDGGAPPIGVVASGLDVPYPPRHTGLWHEVAELGVLLSETPPGRAPDRWRFPARNRILAALAELVVVVESHRGGGSFLTVDHALGRGIQVMAVPGSVRNPAAAGPNALLADGGAPARGAADVLDHLGLSHHGEAPAARVRRKLPADERRVLDAVDWAPTATGGIVAASGLGALDVARCLHQLAELGLVRRGPGWWERQVPPARARRP
jgi:DNA processing protein